LRSPSHEQDPRKRNAPISRVLRATPPRLYSMSGAIYLPTQRNRRTARPTPQTDPHSTQKSKLPREKGEPLTCSLYKQSGGSSGTGSPPPAPAFSLQREYLCSYRGGPFGGSWSGLPWLSYTSRGKELKIRFLTSSPRRASWCLETRLAHPHARLPRPLSHISRSPYY